MRRRWRGIKTAIARTVARIEDRDLPFEAEDRAEDVWLPEDRAGVVDEIARREVVGAVEDHVVIAKDVERVVGRQDAVVRDNVDVRIQIAKMLNRRFELGTADVLRAVKHLAVQVRFVDAIEIDETEASDASGREVDRDRASESARADDQRGAAGESTLSFFAELGKADLPRIAHQGMNAG